MYQSYRDKNPIKLLRVSIQKIGVLKLKNIIHKQSFILDSNSNLSQIIDIFMNNYINYIGIIKSGEIIDVITKKDIIAQINQSKSDPLSQKIICTKKKKIGFCSPENNFEELCKSLLNSKEGFVVYKEDKNYKILDLFDILEILQNSDFTVEGSPLLSRIMNKEIATIDYKTNLKKLMKNFEEHEYSIVIKDGKPYGIITIKDILSSISKGVNLEKIYVENIMSAKLISVTPGTSVLEVLKIIYERKFNQVPILMDQKVIGIVGIKELLNSYMDFVFQLKDIEGNFLIQYARG
jgi:predicted transcriptional regulator